MYYYVNESVIVMSDTVYTFPIAPVQSALFFLNQIHPESLAYNIPVCVRLEGELDRSALQQSLNYLVERHEILRTLYGFDDAGLIQLVQPHGECPLTFEVIGNDSSVDDGKALGSWLTQKVQKHFDLMNGPTMYAELGQLSEFDHCLLIMFHHIAVDHSAVGLYISQLEQVYRRFSQNMDLDLQPQELQYADYVVWLKENSAEEELAERIGVWKQRLTGFSGLLNLPLDRSRPSMSTSSGAQYLFEWSAEKSDTAKKLSSKNSVSLYICLLSVLKILLRQKCNQDDIIVGTPFANRGDQEELEQVMGCFINTLPLAVNFKDIANFDELLATVKERMLEAYDNQSVPFEAIVDSVNPERDHSFNPIFQVGFIFQEPPTEINLSGLKCTTIIQHSGGAMYDLHFWMWEKGETLAGLVWYNTDVFSEETVASLVRDYEETLEWVAEDTNKALTAMARK